MKTSAEILEQLKQLDTTDLLEILKISAEDLVDRFADVVDLNIEQIEYDLEQFFGEEDDYNRWD